MMKMTENELSKASFFGHIARGSAGEKLKMIVAEGWSKVGRERRRRRWMDDVELVTGTKDVRKNIEMAKDKERWREKSLSTGDVQLLQLLAPKDRLKPMQTDGKFSTERIKHILKLKNEYPSQYRKLIWKLLLQIPENYSAYCALVKKELSPKLFDFHEKNQFSNKNFLLSFQKSVLVKGQ
ncbi:TBC1 domain family member 31 [Nymphon striatum]|nr:TBC1 domain family member 31 [Nymphon striatum]